MPYEQETAGWQQPRTNEEVDVLYHRQGRPRGVHGVLRCMTFIDGSWLYHNQEMLVKAYSGPYKIDFSKINVVALKALREFLADNMQTEPPQLDLVRTYYYASMPANVHPDDAAKLEDQRKFYTMLSEVLGFELILHEIDFRGHYMALQDRLDREGDSTFLPKERTVDMALGINMLYLAAIDAYDIAIAVLGDADYQPALERVRQLGKRVLIFTIGGSAAYDYLYPKAGVRYSDFPALRFQDHLDHLRLSPRSERTVYTYSCARCGKLFESTYKASAKQNMYCDEHRIFRDRSNNGVAQTAREPEAKTATLAAAENSGTGAVPPAEADNDGRLTIAPGADD